MLVVHQWTWLIWRDFAGIVRGLISIAHIIGEEGGVLTLKCDKVRIELSTKNNLFLLLIFVWFRVLQNFFNGINFELLDVIARYV